MAILEAAVYLWSKGFVHRDLRPRNIMFHEETNEIHVIDFGITETFEYYGKRRKFIFSDLTHIINLVEYFGLTSRWQPFVTQLVQCQKTDTQKISKMKPEERREINTE